jgi:hypothetical protein
LKVRTCIPFSFFILDIPSGSATSVLDSSTITMPDQASTGKQFTLFPDLPPELRLRIWEFASAIPRSVRLREFVPNERRTPDGLPAAFGPPRCSSILHVCRDSREIALKGYSLINDSMFSAPLYFNEANDTLVLPPNSWKFELYNCSLDDSILRVTSGAVLGAVIERSFDRDAIETTYELNVSNIFYSLLGFPRLKEVIFVELKVEQKASRVFDGESGGGTTQTVESKKDQLQTVINDCVKAAEEALRLIFDVQMLVGFSEFRERRRSAWWMDPKFTLMTEEEFKAHFPLDDDMIG